MSRIQLFIVAMALGILPGAARADTLFSFQTGNGNVHVGDVFKVDVVVSPLSQVGFLILDFAVDPAYLRLCEANGADSIFTPGPLIPPEQAVNFGGFVSDPSGQQAMGSAYYFPDSPITVTIPTTFFSFDVKAVAATPPGTGAAISFLDAASDVDPTGSSMTFTPLSLGVSDSGSDVSSVPLPPAVAMCCVLLGGAALAPLSRRIRRYLLASR